MDAQLAALPMPLAWHVAPSNCRSDEVALLTVRAPGKTDMFVDPSGTEAPALNAPRLLGVPPDEDFQLAARVTVGFGHTFDAGVLLVWSDERTWAKLCFEYSPQGKPMAVSVVTRGSSDDANGFTVDGNQLWLRVSRLGGAWAFHAGTDGAHWHFVRYFTLGLPLAGGLGLPLAGGLGLPLAGGLGLPLAGGLGLPLAGGLGATGEVSVGFEAQSPTGPGCEVTFDQITYRPERLADLRGGA